MRKKINYFIFLLFISIIGVRVINAASTVDFGYDGDDVAYIGQTFTQDIVVKNIAGGKLMGIGGQVTVTNPSCLTFKEITNVDVNSDSNDDMFSFMTMSGITNDAVIVTVSFTPAATECSTSIGILSPTLSFTNGTSLTPGNIYKTIEVKSFLSDDATLKSLSVDDNVLIPEFDSEKTSYRVNLANDVTSAKINAEANDPGATVIGDDLYTDLKIGDNVKTVTVSAANGDSKIYSVNLHRMSNDASLKSITVGSYTLDPLFDPEVLGYTVKIPNNVTSATIAAIPNQDDAVVTGDGSFSDLKIGDNIKTITVLAEDGVGNRTYTVNLRRVSTDATASALSIKKVSDNSAVSYSPTFSSGVISYNATVAKDVDKVLIELSTTDATKKIVGNGEKNLGYGDNSFDIVVTAEDGKTSKTYTVNVHRLISDFSVSGLVIKNNADNSNISYTPVFDANTLTYTARVNTAVSNVNISFITANGTTVVGDGNKTLSIGDNSFDVVVTAADEIISKTYTINIHRISNVLSVTNLKLKNVADNSNISYTPTFNKDVTGYSASVLSNVNKVNISFETSDDTSTITGTGDKTLGVGDNVFNVMVIAEDGVTKKTYTITIRKLSNDVTVTGLKITNLGNNSNIGYTPTFNKDILIYEATVVNGVSSININMTKPNNGASISGDGNKSLVVGDNSFEVVVTAEDGVTKKTYTVNITRLEVITSEEYGHVITSDYIMTVSDKNDSNSFTSVLDVKNQLDNENSKLEIWNAANDTKLSDSDRVGTGMIVKLIIKGQVVDSKIIIIKGDTSGDGIINIIDASMIVNHFLNRVPLTGPYLVAGKISDDDIVNIIDASMIVNHFLNRVKIIFKS